jgi:hypothetical protein
MKVRGKKRGLRRVACNPPSACRSSIASLKSYNHKPSAAVLSSRRGYGVRGIEGGKGENETIRTETGRFLVFVLVHEIGVPQESPEEA